MTGPTITETRAGVSHAELDAVQNAVRPVRARFVGMQDGLLLFRSIDNINSKDRASFQKLADEIAERLLSSDDITVRSVVDKADRVGIT